MVNQYIGMMDRTTNNPCFALLWVELSCKGRCFETFARGRECDCDSDCKKYGKCCSDYGAFCEAGKHPITISASQNSQMCAPTLVPQIMSNTWSISGLDFTNV